MALLMKRWGKTPSGRPQWRIGTEDLSDVSFPANDRMYALFKKHVKRRSELRVLIRQSNSMIVEAPEDLTQCDCDPFLHAVWEETLFK